MTAVCQGHVQTDPIDVLAADGAPYLCGIYAAFWASSKVLHPRERDSSLAQFSHIVIHRSSHLHVVEMGSLCGNSVGQAGGHCMSATRSHQQSHMTHPSWLSRMNSSKGFIPDCAVVTANQRLKTNWGILEIDSGSWPSRKFLPMQ